MARFFCIPGVTFLLIAFILNLIVSISLPSLPILDVTRTTFEQTVTVDGQGDVDELRFGIWAPCYYNQQDDHICASLGYAYDVFVTDQFGDEQVNIAASWTRGLAVHPVATVVSLLATALALSEHVTVVLLATLTAWFACILTLVALLIDLILFGWTKHQFKRLDVGADTSTAPGLWLTVLACVLLFIGGLAIFLGRIRDRRAAKKPAADDAHAEAGHAKEATAATATTTRAAHTKDISTATATASTADEKPEKEKDTDNTESSTADEAQPAKSGWGKKFKFGKKAQD